MDLETFTGPSNGESFVGLFLVSVDKNYDVWFYENNSTKKKAQLIRYRTKEKIWEVYQTDDASYGQIPFSMTVAIVNRIYIAAGIKIYKTKSFFASSESDLININPQPSNWSYDNNEITVIINSRKFDFSNITVSPNATYKVFSDQACANPLSNVVEVPITAAPQGSKTVWLKVTAEDGVGNTVYKIILERYSRSISLTADNNYFYGQYFSPQWRIINPQNLWEGDTFENLGLIIPKITCGGIDPITLLCNKKGTYSITFQDSCNPEYIIDFQITSVNIQPKTIDIDSIDVELSKVYDGKTTAAVKSLKISNILARPRHNGSCHGLV